MRIGSVSWIKKGTYFENAVMLEGHVDFVELLVYTWNDDLKDMLEREWPDLKRLELSYTVHLPTDSIERCACAYAFFKEKNIPIRHFVLHPLPGWEGFIAGKEDVLLENMIRSNAVFRMMALDIGHLCLSKKEQDIFTDERLKAIKEIHLHGVFGNRDHAKLNNRTIRYFSELQMKHHLLREALSRPETHLNFEIFDYKKFLESLRRFKDAYTRCESA